MLNIHGRRCVSVILRTRWSPHQHFSSAGYEKFDILERHHIYVYVSQSHQIPSLDSFRMGCWLCCVCYVCLLFGVYERGLAYTVRHFIWLCSRYRIFILTEILKSFCAANCCCWFRFSYYWKLFRLALRKPTLLQSFWSSSPICCMYTHPNAQRTTKGTFTFLIGLPKRLSTHFNTAHKIELSSMWLKCRWD